MIRIDIRILIRVLVVIIMVVIIILVRSTSTIYPATIAILAIFMRSIIAIMIASVRKPPLHPPPFSRLFSHYKHKTPWRI